MVGDRLPDDVDLRQGSWASNPEKDGRIKQFRNAEVVEFDQAGHWVHHDRLHDFLSTTAEFIK